MKAPICEICLKSDILCPVCSKKLEDGKISDADINVSRFLFRLSDKIKTLKDISVEKVIDHEKTIVIVSGKGDGRKIVGKAGSVVKALAKEFKKSIKVVEKTENMLDFISRVISPAKILAVNKIYTPEGQILKFIVPAKNKIYVSTDLVGRIVNDLFNKKVEFDFE